MKLSFTTLGCPDWDLATIAKRAKEFGYEGVELRTNTDGNHLSPDLPLAEVHRILAPFTEEGIAIMSLMGYASFAHLDKAEVAKNQETTRRLIALAEAMHVPFIRVFGGQFAKGADREKVLRNAADGLRPLAREAAERGVTLGFETHDDWCSGELVARLFDMVGERRGLGVVYDIYNAVIAGLEPWKVTYERIRPFIAYCHLKDGWTDAVKKVHYCAIGAGEMPLNAILSRFKQDHYTGYFSFEWEKKWHPEIEAPERAFPQYSWKVRSTWNEVL